MIRLSEETADRIALDTLKQHKHWLELELKSYQDGEYLHPQDVVNNQQLVKAIDQIIKYFGG